MVIAAEDNISPAEAIRICNSVKYENIEIDVDPIERPKTVDFLDRYELMEDDVRDIIHGLTINDYHDGPVEDTNPKFSKPLWVFIKYINEIQIRVYIKIKIINNRRKVFVFSIHEEGLYGD